MSSCSMAAGLRSTARCPKCESRGGVTRVTFRASEPPSLAGVMSAELFDGRHVVYVENADEFVADLVRSGVAFQDLEVAPRVSRTRSSRSPARARNEARGRLRSSGDHAAAAVPGLLGADARLSGVASCSSAASSSEASPSGCSPASRRPRCSPCLLPVRGRDRGARGHAVGGVSANAARSVAIRLAGRVMSALVFAAVTAPSSQSSRSPSTGVSSAGAIRSPRSSCCSSEASRLRSSGSRSATGSPRRRPCPSRTRFSSHSRSAAACGPGRRTMCPQASISASQFLPTRSWMEILDSIATGDSPLPWHHVAALAAWGVVFFGLAWWGFRRDEGERFR